MASPGQELASLDFHNLIGSPLVAVVNAQAQAAMTTVNFIKNVGFNKLPIKKKFKAQETLDPIYVTFKYPKETAPFQPERNEVKTLTISAAGSGYTTAPNVTITGGGGTGAAATVTIDANGAVNSLALTSPGSGYTSVPTVKIDPPPAGGTQATATATIHKTPAVPAQFQMMALQVPILSMLPVPYLRIEDVKLDFNAKIDSTETFELDQSLEYDQTTESSFGLNLFDIVTISSNFKSSFAFQESLAKGTEVNRTYSLGVQVHAVQAEVPAGLEKLLGILQTAIVSFPEGKTPQKQIGA